MGSSKAQGELWGKAPRGWAEIQEPMHRPIWEAMLDATGVGSGKRFLDVGCGGGGASVLAAERGAQVSGLDAAAGLITFARERVPDGTFHVGDIESLPFELSAPGKLEELFEEAGMEVLMSGEADCPFTYPDFDSFWRANVAAGPFQGVLRVVSEERLKSGVRDAVEPFCLDDGTILIEPNIFRYVVASV